MMSIYALICRELKNAFCHDARRAIFLFGAAAAYLVLFGILYFPGVVKEIPTVICNEENTAYSRKIIQMAADDERLRVTGIVPTIEEARVQLQTKKAYAALVIPAGFSQDICSGHSAQVLFLFNGANIIMTNIASAAGNDIVNAFNLTFASQQAALRTGGNEQSLRSLISPIHTTVRVLNNPTQSYMLFFILGLAMAAMQQGIFLAVGAAVQGDRKAADMLAKVSKPALLAVKLGVYWILAMLSFALICMISAVMGIPNQASFWPLFGLAGAFSFAVISLGIFAASLLENELQYVRASIMYTVPAFVLSGYTWPWESMGTVMQIAAKFFPMTWMAGSLRELFLSGNFAMLFQNILVLMGTGIFFLILGSWLFQRRFRSDG